MWNFGGARVQFEGGTWEEVAAQIVAQGGAQGVEMTKTTHDPEHAGEIPGWRFLKVHFSH